MVLSTAFISATLSSFLAALAIVITKNIHGGLTLDSDTGVQKLHTAPTPRIGGIALCVGSVFGGFALPVDMHWLWWMICLSALPAFLSGLLEDVTKRVGVKGRLFATVFSGLIFSLMTGYQITRVDIPGADWLLSSWVLSLLFTAFAIGGIANAVNIIDGVNGLASGTAIVTLSALAVVAWQVDDMSIVGSCLVTIGALIGFFFLNFPRGRLFLGDAGAYAMGFILAAIAVALPQRNSELSPLIGLLALSYPVIETVASILRRTTRAGPKRPGQPDRLHLHSLVYRSRAKQLAESLGAPWLRNSLTGVMLIGLPFLSSVLTVVSKNSSIGIAASLLVVILVYKITYRKAALMGARFKWRKDRAKS